MSSEHDDPRNSSQWLLYIQFGCLIGNLLDGGISYVVCTPGTEGAAAIPLLLEGVIFTISFLFAIFIYFELANHIISTKYDVSTEDNNMLFATSVLFLVNSFFAFTIVSKCY